MAGDPDHQAGGCHFVGGTFFIIGSQGMVQLAVLSVTMQVYFTSADAEFVSVITATLAFPPACQLNWFARSLLKLILLML